MVLSPGQWLSFPFGVLTSEAGCGEVGPTREELRSPEIL